MMIVVMVGRGSRRTDSSQLFTSVPPPLGRCTGPAQPNSRSGLFDLGRLTRLVSDRKQSHFHEAEEEQKENNSLIEPPAAHLAAARGAKSVALLPAPSPLLPFALSRCSSQPVPAPPSHPLSKHVKPHTAVAVLGRLRGPTHRIRMRCETE